MSNREQIKKEDKKYLGKFILILLVCFVAGIAAGVISAKVKLSGVSFADVWQKAEQVLVYIIPCLFVAGNVIAGILSACWLKKSGKELKEWDGEDEDVADGIEKRINGVVFVSSVFSIVNLFLFGAEMHFVDSSEGPGMISVPMMVMLVCLTLSMIMLVAIQKNAINLSKEMNPEKQGSVYDMHFLKKWENSSDEMELFINYKAAYQAFKAMQIVCIVLFMVCFVLDFPFKTGLLPMLMITIIWLVATVIYMRAVAKLEKRN